MVLNHFETKSYVWKGLGKGLVILSYYWVRFINNLVSNNPPKNMEIILLICSNCQSNDGLAETKMWLWTLLKPNVMFEKVQYYFHVSDSLIILKSKFGSISCWSILSVNPFDKSCPCYQSQHLQCCIPCLTIQLFTF